MRTDPRADGQDPRSRGLTRRQVLAAGGAGVGTLALGGVLSACGTASRTPSAPLPAVDVTLRAMRTDVELGSRSASTWTYDGRLPGRELRLRQGRSVRVRVVNDLEAPTSVHWHGIRLRNRADGVPGFTQEAIKPGGAFVGATRRPDPRTPAGPSRWR